MKKILAIFAVLLFTSSVFAFELPAGKTINKVAVQNAIETYTQKINSNPEAQDAYIDRAFLYFLLDNITAAIADYDTLIRLNSKNEEYF